MNHSRKTDYLVKLSVLCAIALLFAFTPLGYLRLGVVEITLMTLPVAVGAIMLGPFGGAILGALFGASSFIQCFGISAFGSLLLTCNPVGTLLVCFVPRVLCGLLPGLLFKSMYRPEKKNIIPCLSVSLLTPVLNTLFFTCGILLFFYRDSRFQTTMAESDISTSSVWLFLVGLVGINGVLEAVVNGTAGTVISVTLLRGFGKKK
ncbi:MAG: ECF transporter S component [Clostridia bacterium]|nr:ECF transporter S component [Clostridia bacterium]